MKWKCLIVYLWRDREKKCIFNSSKVLLQNEFLKFSFIWIVIKSKNLQHSEKLFKINTATQILIISKEGTEKSLHINSLLNSSLANRKSTCSTEKNFNEHYFFRKERKKYVVILSIPFFLNFFSRYLRWTYLEKNLSTIIKKSFHFFFLLDCFNFASARTFL